MYSIIGADGSEYGPVSADQLRQWIVEGRANAQTRVQVEGAAEWKLLSELGEFAPLFAAPESPMIAPAPFPVATPRRTNQMALAAMVLGVLSVTAGCCCYGLPFNVVGIICSMAALSQLSKDPGSQGKGMAIAGLVLSILSLLMAFSFSGSDLLRKLNRL